MTLNQDETYLHDLGRGKARATFYTTCFGNFLGGTRTTMLVKIREMYSQFFTGFDGQNILHFLVKTF